MLTFALWAGVLSLELEWTSYSDENELPLSENRREEIRQKMRKVDTSKLSPEDKEKFKSIWSKLNRTEKEEDDVSFTTPIIILLGLAAAYVYYRNPAPAAPQGNVVSENSGKNASPEDLREARLRRFETPNDDQADAQEPEPTKASPRESPKEAKESYYPDDFRKARLDRFDTDPTSGKDDNDDTDDKPKPEPPKKYALPHAEPAATGA